MPSPPCCQQSMELPTTPRPDQAFSIVDRKSWAVMQRLGVHEAIAFDTDYAVYRFGLDRRQAFTVHA